MNELRRDPLLGRWVVVYKQSHSPEDYVSPKEVPLKGSCLLCAQSETATEVLSYKDEQGKPLVRVIRTEGSIFSYDIQLERRGVGMYDMMNSFGVSEVVLETPEHGVAPEDLGAEQMERVIDAYYRRTLELEKDERIRYVMIHKNCGALSGDLCGHSHSFITATPIIPKRIKEELDGAKGYFGYKERCIFCDIMREEKRFNRRIVKETEHFFAFCPFATRFPFEIWIMPKRHSCFFKEITDEERSDLAVIMTDVIGRLRKVLKNPPYNFVFHSAPSKIPKRAKWHTLGEDFHWHIEIMPRVRRLTGFELGSGMYTLTTSPEDAAKFLKEVSYED
ncbi:MAG: galactose-1-phosphate uridylyltransferase [Nitrospirae bacterium]|nr:MAG: galactose-1-phosphate uridylyltransferase [Nitrospirota bacterium]